MEEAPTSLFSNISMDAVIVGVFLLTTLIAAFGYKKKKKNNQDSFEDYALGGRNFSTAALVATMVATLASGSGFFITAIKVYSGGLLFIITLLCMAIQFLVVGYVLAPRMGEFFGDKSVAESMGKMYGKEVRLITVITGTIGASGFIAVQFKAFGTIFGYFANFSADLAIIVAALIVTLYSALGGIKAVTITDIIQFGAFGIAVPLIAILIWGHVYETDISVVSAFNNPKFDYTQVLNFGNPELLPMIALMLYFAFPALLPADYQRVLMGKGIRQVKIACGISAMAFTAVILITSWIPFLIFNIDPTLNANEIPVYIVENYSGIVGLKGLMIIGIVAMAMSTGDSHINSSSVLIANDLFVPLGMKKEQRLFMSKICSFVLGTSAMLLALSGKDLLSIILTANSFYMPVVTIPLFLAILGFRTTKMSVLIAMGAGFTTTIIWKIYEIPADSIFVSMAVNLLFLIGSHYLFKQKGGWNQSKDTKYLTEYREIQRQKRQEFWHTIKGFRPVKIIEYVRDHAPENEVRYTGLGIYFVIYTITTMYLTMGKSSTDKELMMTTYQIMLVSSILIMIYPIWPLSLKKEIKEPIIKTWWYFSIFYMLMFFNSLFMIIHDFGGLQFAIFSINILVAILLIGWKPALIMFAAGFWLSTKFHHIYVAEMDSGLDMGNPQFVIMYIALVIASVVLLFIKPQQEYLAETENKVGELGEKINHYGQKLSDQEKEISRLEATGQRILNNVNHELRLPVGNVMNFAEMIHSGLENLNKSQLKEISSEVYKNSTRLSSMILNMLDLSALKTNELKLQKKTINFSELVEDRVSTCKKLYLDNKKLNFELNIEPNILIDIDANYMRQVVDNLVINSIKYSEKGTITVAANSDDNHVFFDISDEGIGIPKLDIYDVFKPFTVSSKTLTPAEGRGVGLALCKRAVEAHDGNIEVYSDGNTGATFKFELPK